MLRVGLRGESRLRGSVALAGFIKSPVPHQKKSSCLWEPAPAVLEAGRRRRAFLCVTQSMRPVGERGNSQPGLCSQALSVPLLGTQPCRGLEAVSARPQLRGRVCLGSAIGNSGLWF